MSLSATPVPPVPGETARVAQAAFPHGQLYLRLRDAFPALFTDALFADLFAPGGRPAQAPWRLALVTLLQFAENLSDQQAADAVRSRLDWKYLLSLELTDPGFDSSLLGDFRARLLAGAAELRLFEHLLACFQEQRLLKARGKQRTDSTHVLAAVRTLNRLELVGETLRHTLNALAGAAPEWLLAHLDPAWRERYDRRFPDQRLPRGQAAREALATTIGQDGAALLAAVDDPAAPAALREVPAVAVLRAVWAQQYAWDEPPSGAPRWRRGEELPAAAALIQSPYDPEAHYSARHGAPFVGYMAHVTESCAPDQPLLITDAHVTPATTPDQEALAGVHARLAQRGLLPDRHYVDSGYVTAPALVRSAQEHGVTVVGPPHQDGSWQRRAGTGFALAHFAVNFAAQVVTCPGGHQSVRWQPKKERGREVIAVDFARRDCQACPHQAQCTRAADHGRRLTLRPEAEHTAWQAAQGQARTAAFAAEYRMRAGVEGTHSQAVRRCGLRDCRYLGERKTGLQQLLTMAALNLVRAGYWLLETPRARTRTDAFMRLGSPLLGGVGA